MTKPLLELTSPDSNFSVTVGRSSPTFIYGVRNLPDGQGGYPAFVFDTQALTTDRETGEVIVDTSYQYSYGGDDGRDLTSRSHEIPIGRFGFTRVDLTLTKDEEEDSNEVIYTREFEIAENFRRVTGETDFSASLGTESLGTITPGRDLRIGQNVNLRVWGLKVLVRVDGLTSGQYGWECSVASVPMITPRNITGSWTKRVSPSRASGGGDTSSGYSSGYNESSYGGYDSGEMIHVGDEVSHLSERIRLLEDEHLVSNLGGALESNRLQLIKKFRDGTEETIDLGEISGGGGGGLPSSITLLPGNVISNPGGAFPQEGHSARITATMRGVDRLHEEITDHLKDLSPQHSESRWSGSGTGDYILEDIGPLENVSTSGLGAFSWVLSEDIQGGWNYEWGSRPLQDKGLLCGLIYLSINYVGKNGERGTHNAVARISNPGNRSVSVLFQDRVDSDWNIRVTSTQRNLNIQSNIDSATEGSTDVNAIFIPDYGEMSKAFNPTTGIGRIDKKITPSYSEGSAGLAIENVFIGGIVSGTVA